MKNHKQQPIKTQEQDNFTKYRIYIVNFGDAIFRGLIGFFLIGVVGYFILVGFLHMKIYWVLPITFLSYVFLSPLFSKIKITDYLLGKYENFLGKMFNLK